MVDKVDMSLGITVIETYKEDILYFCTLFRYYKLIIRLRLGLSRGLGLWLALGLVLSRSSLLEVDCLLHLDY